MWFYTYEKLCALKYVKLAKFSNEMDDVFCVHDFLIKIFISCMKYKINLELI